MCLCGVAEQIQLRKDGCLGSNQTNRYEIVIGLELVYRRSMVIVHNNLKRKRTCDDGDDDDMHAHYK